MVVGSAQQLAKCSKGPKDASAKGTQLNLPTGAAEEKPEGAGAGEGEGVFSGMERISAPKGSVMVWSGAQTLEGEFFTQFFMILPVYVTCFQPGRLRRVFRGGGVLSFRENTRGPKLL